MDKENIVELTNKLYKLTLLFPKKEPLRYKIREAADDISANFVTLEALRNFNPGNLATDWERRYKDSLFLIGKDLEILKSYFETAKWQNWVSYFDVLEIEAEYDKIRYKTEGEIKDLEIIVDENIEEKSSGQPIRQGHSAELSRSPQGCPECTEGQEVLIPNFKTEDKDKTKDNILDSRKKKILETLQEKGRAQVWEIKKIFPEVSKRTLRRDFEKLLKQGLIERMGERNNTFYQIKTG